MQRIPPLFVRPPKSVSSGDRVDELGVSRRICRGKKLAASTPLGDTTAPTIPKNTSGGIVTYDSGGRWRTHGRDRGGSYSHGSPLTARHQSKTPEASPTKPDQVIPVIREYIRLIRQNALSDKAVDLDLIHGRLLLGVRPSKVIVNALGVGFHLIVHRALPFVGSRDLVASTGTSAAACWFEEWPRARTDTSVPGLGGRRTATVSSCSPRRTRGPGPGRTRRPCRTRSPPSCPCSPQER
jgi:hypothetical protein